MQIDSKLLQRLEVLSQIQIDETKKDEILKELNRFLEFAENLNELDISKLEATFTTLEGGSPFRKDEPRLNEEIGVNILKRAPKSSDNFFIVPKIIE